MRNHVATPTPDLGPNPFVTDPYRSAWISVPIENLKPGRNMRSRIRQFFRRYTPRFGTGGSRSWK